MELTTSARLGQLILECRPDPTLLLGAGASLKSGVPLAGDIAELAARHAYCRELGFDENDQSMRRSDWHAWLTGQRWFDASVAITDQYARVVERLLRPRAERREFFLRIISPTVPRSPGYDALAELAGLGLLQSILTPNFDRLIHDACRSKTRPRRVEWIQSPDQADLISTSPPEPQVIHLHGSVEHYNDQNLEEETQSLDPRLKDRLLPLLRDHSLIVIGYRGAEPSIMHDLLMPTAASSGNFRHGIYWCTLDARPTTLHPLVRELAEEIRSNFALVEIEGFDQVLLEWREMAAAARVLPPPVIARHEAAAPDLEKGKATLDDFDWPLVSRTLEEYAQKLGLEWVPASGRPALEARLVALELAVDTDDGLVPTRGGELLFSRSARCRLEIKIANDPLPHTIEGNVLSVLERALDALADFNEPFTLKGQDSQVVRPYPPLALKELMVNALVHRDHANALPVEVEVRADEITITNPGGLFGLEPSQLGQPGQKAYRNPLLADICYGTGLMDKRGSGLVDVLRWSRENGGAATFAAGDEDEIFTATLTSRPERPDPATGTATPEQNLESFTSNILPLRIIGEDVHLAPTRFARREDVFAAFPGTSFPPFAIEGALVTLSDLADRSNPLRDAVEAEPEPHRLEEFFADEDRRRILVQLLNRSLNTHARSRGLRAAPRQRFYFPGSELGARVVNYRARLRKASRTVARPVLRKGSADVRFWEHECVHYQFKQFEDEWALTLVPSWLFTKDGRGELLGGPGVARLANRRSARDFNTHVTNDLVFWTRALIGDADDVLLDDHTNRIAIAGRPLSLDLIPAPPAPGLDEQGDERETIETVLEEVAAALDASEESDAEHPADGERGEAA